MKRAQTPEAIADRAIKLLTTEHAEAGRDRRSQSADGRIVPAPTAPMHVARELVKSLYTESVGLLLRDHRGDFYRYDGECWPELDRQSVRTDAYRWLEDAVYKKAEGMVHEAWNPTRS